MKVTRNFIGVIVLLALFAISAYSEDDDDHPRWRYKHGFFRGGAGGFEVMYLNLDLPALNQKLVEVGLPSMDDHMILTGGGGWAFLGKGIRIGGYGFGGSVSKDGKPYHVQKEVTLSMGLGGFLVEKVFHPFNNTELYLGLSSGGGGIDIKMVQWTGPRSWDELWSEFGIDTLGTEHTNLDYEVKLSRGFGYLMPTIGFRYNIFRWFAVGFNVNYIYCWKLNSWKHEGKKVTGVPEIDFSNVSYRINFYFGG